MQNDFILILTIQLPKVVLKDGRKSAPDAQFLDSNSCSTTDWPSDVGNPLNLSKLFLHQYNSRINSRIPIEKIIGGSSYIINIQ